MHFFASKVSSLLKKKLHSRFIFVVINETLYSLLLLEAPIELRKSQRNQDWVPISMYQYKCSLQDRHLDTHYSNYFVSVFSCEEQTWPCNTMLSTEDHPGWSSCRRSNSSLAAGCRREDERFSAGNIFSSSCCHASGRKTEKRLLGGKQRSESPVPLLFPGR